MRHVILGCLLFLAACGGDLRKETEARPEAVEAAARQAAVTSAAGHALLQKYSALVSEDTLDSCVRAWFGESASGDSSSRRPVYKPDVDGFRSFLCDCAAHGENCP
jgi:hypothetical protein